MNQRILLLVFGLFLLNSCYENIEGCLDVNATNFEVTTDRACNECCTYPSLKLSVQHRFSQTNPDTIYRFAADRINTLDSVNYFSINQLKYYISDLKLLKSDGTAIGVEEELEVVSISSSSGDTTFTLIPDNFALINLRDFSSSTIGTFRQNGSFVGIEFNIGLPEENVRDAAPQFFDSNHPLAFSDSMLYDFEEEQYIVTQLNLVRDTTFFTGTDTTQINILAADFFEKITLELPFTIEIGFNTLVAIRADYRKWLEGIDLKNDNATEIARKLKENIPSSFTLVEVAVTN